MSAQAFGGHLPAIVTLDDLAAMNTADQHGHRYKLSYEGTLSVMPPPDPEHAAIASRILVWFPFAGWPADHLLQAAGIRCTSCGLTVSTRSPRRCRWPGSCRRVRPITSSTIGKRTAAE